MGRKGWGQRNDSGSLLASSLIIGLGGGSCLFMVGAMAPNSLPLAGGILGGIFFVFMTLVALQRFSRGLSLDLGFLAVFGRNRRDDGVQDYQPRRAGSGHSEKHVGTNQPITANEAHELRINSASTWVPARGRRQSEKK
ncbi:MAG TPA: hypothetical protein DCR20_03295 [Planctomycetaceae bacterium]|nr:hypothetical protein [Planctomycetaceae bacterium]